jgi:hypothetical protein
MRVARSLAVLGALVVAAALPSLASASSPAVIHLFFDNQQQISTDTGFTSTSSVSWGDSVSHGPVVGKSMLKCAFVTDSVARCTASIVFYKPGTSTVDKSVFLKDELINFNNPVFAIQGGTGAWAGVHGGVVLVHNVSDTASNVELDLVF